MDLGIPDGGAFGISGSAGDSLAEDADLCVADMRYSLTHPSDALAALLLVALISTPSAAIRRRGPDAQDSA